MSGPVVVLCSGQGGQHRGMFELTGRVAAAEPVFAAAAAFLDGVDPRRFVHEASEDSLFANAAGQILCCTQALAAWAMLSDVLPDRIVLAGYSVGELAAWGCAGLFAPDQLLALAARRAALMDQAAPAGSGLAAVVGLARPALLRLLAMQDAHLAIDNEADSVVVGGTGEALDRLLVQARGQGATTARRLRVAVPSHTRLLSKASAAFAEVLAGQTLHQQDERIRLLSGLDGDTVRRPQAGLRKLAEQISTTIDWSACLQTCEEAGAMRVLELGPGSALARMAEQRPVRLTARAIDQFRTAQGVRDWLSADS